MQYKKIIKKKKLRNSVLQTVFSRKIFKIKEKKTFNFFFSFYLTYLETQKFHKNLQLFTKQQIYNIKKKIYNLISLNTYLFNFFYFLSLKNKRIKFGFLSNELSYLDRVKFLFITFQNNSKNFIKKTKDEILRIFIKKTNMFSSIIRKFIKITKKLKKKKIKIEEKKNKNNLGLKDVYFKNSTFFGVSKIIFKIKKKEKNRNNKIVIPAYLFKKEKFNVFKKKYKKKIKFVFPKIEMIKIKKGLNFKEISEDFKTNVLQFKFKEKKTWYRKHRRYSKFKRKIVLRKYKLRRKFRNFHKKLYLKKRNSQKTKFSRLFGFSNGETVLLQKKNKNFSKLKNEKKVKVQLMIDQRIFGISLYNTKKKNIYNLQVNNLVDNIFSEYLDLKQKNWKHVNLLTFRHNFFIFVKNFFVFKKEKKKTEKSKVSSLKPGFLVINSYKNNLFASFLSHKKEVSVKLSLGLLKFNEKKYDFLSYVNVFRGLSFLLFYYGNIEKMIKTYQKTSKLGEIRINFIKRNVLRNKRRRKRIILQIFLLKYGRYIKKVKKRFDRKIKRNKILNLFLSKNKKFKISLQKIFMKRVKNFLTEHYRAKRQKRRRYRRYSYFESRMRFLVLMELDMLRSEKRLAHNLRYGIVNPGFGYKKPQEMEEDNTEMGLQEEEKKKRKMKTSLADYKKKLYAIADRTSKQTLTIYRRYIRAKSRRPFFFRHMDLYRPRRIRMYNVKKEFKKDKFYARIKFQHRKLASLFKFKKLLTKKRRTRKRRVRKKKVSVKNLQIFKLLNSKVQKKILGVIYDFRKVLTKRSSLFSKYKILTRKQKKNLTYIGKFVFPKVWSKLLSRDNKIKKMVSEVKRHNLWINTFLKDVTYGKGKPQTIEKILADKARYRAKYLARKKKRRKLRNRRAFFKRKKTQVKYLKRKVFENLRKKKVFLQKFRRFTLNFIMSWGLFFFKKQLKIKLITKTLNYFQYSLRQFILIKNYLSQIKTKKYYIRIKMKYTGDLADLIYFNLSRFLKTAQRKKWMKFYSKLIRIYFAKYKSVKRKKKIYLSDYKI